MEKIPDAEPLAYEIPESLKPKEDGVRFPALTNPDLIALADKQWERIGVIVLVLDPDGNLLTVTHGPGNPKVPAGTMGIISETLTFDADSVEQPLEGIGRLFVEELGLTAEEIQTLHLEAVEHGAWQNVTFPLGAGRNALGFVVVLRADQRTADTMIQKGAGFKPTTEIRFANFMRPEPLASNAPIASIFRKGTPQVVQAAMELLTTPRPHSRVDLPLPREKKANALEDLKDLLRP
jgi:hypothetical protein